MRAVDMKSASPMAPAEPPLVCHRRAAPVISLGKQSQRPALSFYASMDIKNKVAMAGHSFGIRSDVLAALSCAQRLLSS
jgi:hypothetical protein